MAKVNRSKVIKSTHRAHGKLKGPVKVLRPSHEREVSPKQAAQQKRDPDKITFLGAALAFVFYSLMLWGILIVFNAPFAPAIAAGVTAAAMYFLVKKWGKELTMISAHMFFSFAAYTLIVLPVLVFKTGVFLYGVPVAAFKILLVGGAILLAGAVEYFLKPYGFYENKGKITGYWVTVAIIALLMPVLLNLLLGNMITAKVKEAEKQGVIADTAKLFGPEPFGDNCNEEMDKFNATGPYKEVEKDLKQIKNFNLFLNGNWGPQERALASALVKKYSREQKAMREMLIRNNYYYDFDKEVYKKQFCSYSEENPYNFLFYARLALLDAKLQILSGKFWDGRVTLMSTVKVYEALQSEKTIFAFLTANSILRSQLYALSSLYAIGGSKGIAKHVLASQEESRDKEFYKSANSIVFSRETLERRKFFECSSKMANPVIQFLYKWSVLNLCRDTAYYKRAAYFAKEGSLTPGKKYLEMGSKAPYAISGYIMDTGIYDSGRLFDTQRRLLDLVFAAYDYKGKTGKFPANAGEFIDFGVDKPLLFDPFSPKDMFRVKETKQGILIYSVGENRKDDNGSVENNDDIGFYVY